MYIFKNVNEETTIAEEVEPVNEVFGISKQEKTGKKLIEVVKSELKEKAKEIIKMAGANSAIDAIPYDKIEKDIDKIKNVGSMAVKVCTFNNKAEAIKFHYACVKTLGDEFSTYIDGNKIVLGKVLRVNQESVVAEIDDFEEIQEASDEIWSALFELQEAEFEEYKAMVTYDFAEMSLDKDDERIAVLEDAVAAKQSGVFAGIKRVIDTFIAYISTTIKNITTKLKTNKVMTNGKKAIAYMDKKAAILSAKGPALISFSSNLKDMKDMDAFVAFKEKYEEKFNELFDDGSGNTSDTGTAMAHEVLNSSKHFSDVCLAYTKSMKQNIAAIEFDLKNPNLLPSQVRFCRFALSVANSSIRQVQTWYDKGLKLANADVVRPNSNIEND